MAKPARSRCNCFRCPTSRMSSQISIFGPAGSNFSNVAFGSITTGSSEQQFRPCPLCPESGRKLATRDMPLWVDGDAYEVSSSQQPVERWHGAASANLGRGIVSLLRAVKRLHRGTSRRSISVCVLRPPNPIVPRNLVDAITTSPRLVEAKRRRVCGPSRSLIQPRWLRRRPDRAPRACPWSRARRKPLRSKRGNRSTCR